MTPEQIKRLEAPLDPKNVKPAPQGKYGDYVDAHHVISEANGIFGHDGWSYQITSLQMCSRVEAKDKSGNPQIRVGYRCTVKATVGDIYREGAAVGTGMGKPDNEADAHESAVKEAETDALKRALRSFGNTFGLALYDKTKANVQARPSTLSDEERAEIMTMIEGTGISVGDFLAVGNWSDLREVPAFEFENAKRWILKRARERQPA